MGWLTKFFSWLWESLKNTASSLTTIFAQLSVAFSTIITSTVAVKETVTSGSSVMNATNDLGSQAISTISSLFSAQHDILKIGIYSLSLDVLFQLAMSFITIIIAIFTAFTFFFVLSVPVYIINIYIVKSTAWLISFILPAGWVPQGLYKLADFNSKLVPSVFKAYINAPIFIFNK